VEYLRTTCRGYDRKPLTQLKIVVKQIIDEYSKPAKNANSMLPYKREPLPQAPKPVKKPAIAEPTVRLSDLGGIDNVMGDIQDLIMNPFQYP
jgi:hypothetical protein